MEWFDIVRGKPTIRVSAITIPEVRAIWDSDTSDDKSLADRKLTLIYHIAHRNSPYAVYPDEVRREKVIADFAVGFPVDAQIENAVVKMQDFRTSLEFLFDSANTAIYNLGKFISVPTADVKTVNAIKSALKELPYYVNSYKISRKAMLEDLEVNKRSKKNEIEISDILEDEFED